MWNVNESAIIRIVDNHQAGLFFSHQPTDQQTDRRPGFCSFGLFVGWWAQQGWIGTWICSPAESVRFFACARSPLFLQKNHPTTKTNKNKQHPRFEPGVARFPASPFAVFPFSFFCFVFVKGKKQRGGTNDEEMSAFPLASFALPFRLHPNAPPRPKKENKQQKQQKRIAN